MGVLDDSAARPIGAAVMAAIFGGRSGTAIGGFAGRTGESGNVLEGCREDVGGKVSPLTRGGRLWLLCARPGGATGVVKSGAEDVPVY